MKLHICYGRRVLLVEYTAVYFPPRNLYVRHWYRNWKSEVHCRVGNQSSYQPQRPLVRTSGCIRAITGDKCALNSAIPYLRVRPIPGYICRGDARQLPTWKNEHVGGGVRTPNPHLFRMVNSSASSAVKSTTRPYVRSSMYSVSVLSHDDFLSLRCASLYVGCSLCCNTACPCVASL